MSSYEDGREAGLRAHDAPLALDPTERNPIGQTWAEVLFGYTQTRDRLRAVDSPEAQHKADYLDGFLSVWG